MDTLKAFARGEENRNKEMMVFDWEKAAELIKKHKSAYVEAGLQGDLEWTGGIIYENGKTVKNSYTYLSSTWAIPVVILEGEEIPCFAMESELAKRKRKWNCDTKWPKSALSILKG